MAEGLCVFFLDFKHEFVLAVSLAFVYVEVFERLCCSSVSLLERWTSALPMGEGLWFSLRFQL